jgi:hypothetical protein
MAKLFLKKKVMSKIITSKSLNINNKVFIFRENEEVEVILNYNKKEITSSKILTEEEIEAIKEKYFKNGK